MAKTTSKKTSSKAQAPSKDADKDKLKPKLNAKQDGKPKAPEMVAKKAKSGSAKKSKGSKKQNDAELDEGILTDEVEATEEIPDLTDFEEEEEVEVEADSDDGEEASDEGGVDAETARANGDDEEIILTDAEGRRLCRVRECDQAAIVESYCRFHYLQNWKRIQVRRKILADGKLERYVDELTSRYPDKFLEMIRKDLRSEKDFLVSIAELEIDESAVDNDFEDESQNFIDEVRGVTETTISDDEEF